jgi:hypothetical protein
MTPTLLYSQRDPAWAAQHYGLNPAAPVSTIGAYGGGITAIAQKLTLGGWPTTPLEVQETLARHGGYIPSGTYNYINWPRLPDLYEPLIYNGRHDFGSTPNPLPQSVLDLIQARLERREPALVYVDANRYLGGLQQHFVLVVGRNTAGTWNIINPWNGRLQTLRAYGDTDPLAVRGLILLDFKRSQAPG